MYKNVQYLTCTDIDKRIINNIAVNTAIYILGGHVTDLDWYVHTCQHMNM